MNISLILRSYHYMYICNSAIFCNVKKLTYLHKLKKKKNREREGKFLLN